MYCLILTTVIITYNNMDYISYIHLQLKEKLAKIYNELFLRLTYTVDALKCGSALCCYRNSNKYQTGVSRN